LLRDVGNLLTALALVPADQVQDDVRSATLFGDEQMSVQLHGVGVGRVKIVRTVEVVQVLGFSVGAP
jgi:hypothetical protein